MLLKVINYGYRNIIDFKLSVYMQILELHLIMSNSYFPIYFKVVCKDYYSIEHHYGFYIYENKSEDKYKFFLFLAGL
jgi:purine-cytosine permease-like protein